jgi:hypothetical protein
MKLTTVLGAVNNNPNYYLFIPKQILFWNKFDIKFIAIFVGDKIPDELIDCSNNIILWNKNLDLNTAYVSQNIRIFYPALLQLPDDEMVMITDMDMLPTKGDYYKNNLEHFNKNDFIYYRNIDGDQIYMCYNASHPSTWSKVFDIQNENDIYNKIIDNYNHNYNGIPGSTGWFIDQQIMFKYLKNYKHLKILKRPIRRLEMYMFMHHLKHNQHLFLNNYDDAHFHRSYCDNIDFILHSEKQLHALYI